MSENYRLLNENENCLSKIIKCIILCLMTMFLLWSFGLFLSNLQFLGEPKISNIADKCSQLLENNIITFIILFFLFWVSGIFVFSKFFKKKVIIISGSILFIIFGIISPIFTSVMITQSEGCKIYLSNNTNIIFNDYVIIYNQIAYSWFIVLASLIGIIYCSFVCI